MRSMTDTQLSRYFSEMLDAVEQGEEILVFRDGVAVARLVPERQTIAEQIDAAMARFPVDPNWADDLEAVVRELRAEPNQERTWTAE
jgi:antitoxin (DNA-binding transcriptional repressor) of toxin-antitoxin stability system